MSRSPSLRRHLLPALTGCLLLLLGALAATARADEYGGLGPLGAFTPGANGGHLEVNPEGNRAFGVDPADGDSYVADEIEVAGKHYFRIQKLGAKGEFLAETRVELGREAAYLEGVAIDGVKERLYLLVVTTREGDHEEIQEKISEDEEKTGNEKGIPGTKARKKRTDGTAGKRNKDARRQDQKTRRRSARVRPRSAGGGRALRVLDDDARTGRRHTHDRQGTACWRARRRLGPLSEEAGVPLLDPHGIAVDPVTHDVLILGQQDESKKKGEEEPRAAVQRVHTEGAAEGELGPRYVDSENCLDEGATIASEPACAEGVGQPTSPFVSPGGRVYGMRAGELWEIPASEGAAEAFASHPKVYEAKPKRLFTIGRGQGIGGEEGIVEPLVESEQGGALAFVPTGPASGRIYLDAEITAEEGGGTVSKNKGAAVLGYDEDGGTPSARELGWTAGQNGTSEDEKCLLPLGNGQLLLGADGTGRLLLFDVTTSPATVNVLQFGAGGEECGHARATPPSVSVSGVPVTKLPKGKTASLSLNVFAADALSVEWRFEDNGKAEADEPPSSKAIPSQHRSRR